MGSSSTKFRKHLQSGDEVQALQLYRTNAELRKALDPNCSYGDSHHHETPLHLASRHAMQMLLGIFLFSKMGNPNKTNVRKETCLHSLCKDSGWQSVHSHKRRAECLNYLLKWRGARLGEGTLEKIDLSAQDEKLNTALHYAAASGLAQCVETLIQQGAPLFIENEDSLTPCDTAERNGHADIALFLESKMVFSNDDEPQDEEDDVSMPPMEEYSGLRPQDLQEAKDMLLVETADMLSVPLFTAEALLRNHEWSRETLLESWMNDPVTCCEKCGVTPPASLFSDKPQVQENLASPLPSPLHSSPMALDAECDICANTFLIADEPVHMTCTHKFCKECWERYLNVKIQEGDAHHITCPAYNCTMLVPVDVIEGIVSRDMARRYLQFDIKAFVDSNPDMKWCPFPGCGRAVKLPELDTGRNSRLGQRNRIPSDTSRGVDCGVGHYFCWECLEESHEPCSCANWQNWFGKISDVKPETLHDTEQETEVAANCLWLVTNSKPCPNCKSPIQKNEGCNHMKCSKCKYDFCWVCLEQWKRHNSSTGGYFMCNRYEVVKKVEEQSAMMVTDAESKNKNMQELNRFVHYYTRFKNHENSFKLEEPLLKTAKDKMMKLAEAVTDSATAQAETKFVEDAVQQLLKARRVLKCSYVYGYYLDGPGYKKIVFEFMQTELEECTEILSQTVNRLYLRTPRRKIIDQAHVVQRKRQEFIMAISKGLVPAETPPSVRKKRKKKKKTASDVVDEDLHRAIVASIQEVDPANPWIKDASGKHTNIVTLLDWPSEDSDDSDAETDQKEKKASIGKCQRAGCPKLRAMNPRTQESHDYCSCWCMLADRDDKVEEKEEGVSDVVLDEHMELLRALEMSRLQYLRESGLLHVPDSQQSAISKGTQTRRHKHRPRSNSAGQDVKSRPVVSSMEDFDIELQRFQELSAGFPKDHNDIYDLRQPDGKMSHHRYSRKHNQMSRFDEDKSTIVTRVPNKSVEDLYCLEPSLKCSKQGQTSHSGLGSPILGSTSSPGLSSSPTFTSISTGRRNNCPTALASPPPDLLSFTSSGEKDKAATASSSIESNSSKAGGGLYSTMFGTIKDLSVSNIHSSESDKTKEFSNKDLASLFSSLDFDDTFQYDDDVIASTSWSNSPPRNDMSFMGSSKKMMNSEAESALFLSSGKGESGKSRYGKSVVKSSEKRKSRSGLVRTSGESDALQVESPYSLRKKRSSPTSLFHASADVEVEGDEEEALKRREGEVSLLKMAENLVQMTADVHLRMKEVEKGIRDLDSRSKMESLKRGGGSKLLSESSTVKGDVGVMTWLSDAGGDGGELDAGVDRDWISGAVGGDDSCVGVSSRVLRSTCDVVDSPSSDVEDVEQWFDVPDIVPAKENTNKSLSSHQQSLFGHNENYNSPNVEAEIKDFEQFDVGVGEEQEETSEEASLSNQAMASYASDDLWLCGETETTNSSSPTNLDNDLSITSADIDISTLNARSHALRLGVSKKRAEEATPMSSSSQAAKDNLSSITPLSSFANNLLPYWEQQEKDLFSDSTRVNKDLYDSSLQITEDYSMSCESPSVLSSGALYRDSWSSPRQDVVTLDRSDSLDMLDDDLQIEELASSDLTGAVGGSNLDSGVVVEDKEEEEGNHQMEKVDNVMKSRLKGKAGEPQGKGSNSSSSSKKRKSKKEGKTMLHELEEYLDSVYV